MRAGNAGDADSYRRLLLHLTPVLRAVARRGLARAGMADTEAEDIVQETPVGIRVAGIAGTHQQGPLLFSSIAAQNGPITLIRPPTARRYIVRAASLSRFCHGKYPPRCVTPALFPA